MLYTSVCLAIERDLRGSVPVICCDDALYIFERHAGRPMVDPSLLRRQWAYCDGQVCVFAAGLSRSEYRAALIHELVHLISSEPRWEHLNAVAGGAAVDRSEFIEMVAECVGKRFK